MGQQQIIKSLVITALFIGGLSLGINNSAYGWGENHDDNKPTKKGCEKATNFEDYAERVDNMLCKDEYIDVEEFLIKYKDSMTDEQKDCILYRADLGNQFYENEVLYCWKQTT